MIFDDRLSFYISLALVEQLKQLRIPWRVEGGRSAVPSENALIIVEGGKLFRAEKHKAMKNKQK